MTELTGQYRRNWNELVCSMISDRITKKIFNIPVKEKEVSENL
jgi:hypothetical protein